jgi:hypothetical protein
MEFEIISETEYESLPEDPEEKFVALESICRRNMNRMINDDTSGNFDNLIRLQYMATVSAAADELGVEEFEFPTYNSDFDYPRFADFSLKANGLVTRLLCVGRRKAMLCQCAWLARRGGALNSKFKCCERLSMRRKCPLSSAMHY